MIRLQVFTRHGKHVVSIDDSGDAPSCVGIELVAAAEPPTQMPSPTIAGAAAFLAQNLGMKKEPSPETVETRKAECMACPDNDLGRCLKCGCYLYSKVRVRDERCPIGKWLPEA